MSKSGAVLGGGSANASFFGLPVMDFNGLIRESFSHVLEVLLNVTAHLDYRGDLGRYVGGSLRSFLSVADVLRVGLVCHRWNAIARHPSLVCNWFCLHLYAYNIALIDC